MGAGRDAGAALRAILPTFGSAVGYGADALVHGISTANGINPATLPVGAAVGRGSLDFLTGLATGRPTISSVGQVVDAPIGHPINYMLPAAASVPKPAAAAIAPAAAAAPKAKAADPDLYSAFSKLSFRQLGALGQVAGETRPLGSSARPPTSADVAGQQLMSIYQPMFEKALSKAPDDTTKQRLIDQYSEKVLIPLALKGNTADQYIYGPQGSQ